MVATFHSQFLGELLNQSRTHTRHTSGFEYFYFSVHRGENPCTDVLIRVGVTMVTKLPCINIQRLYRSEDHCLNSLLYQQMGLTEV